MWAGWECIWGNQHPLGVLISVTGDRPVSSQGFHNPANDAWYKQFPYCSYIHEQGCWATKGKTSHTFLLLCSCLILWKALFLAWSEEQWTLYGHSGVWRRASPWVGLLFPTFPSTLRMQSFYLFIQCVWLFCLVYICAPPPVPGSHGDQKRTLGPDRCLRATYGCWEPNPRSLWAQYFQLQTALYSKHISKHTKRPRMLSVLYIVTSHIWFDSSSFRPQVTSDYSGLPSAESC